MRRARGFLTTHRVAALAVTLAVAIAVMGLTPGAAAAATSFVGAGAVRFGTATNPNAASIEMTVPAGAVGDLLICQVNFRGGTTATPSTFSGWTLLNRWDSTTLDGQAIYYRVATTTTEGPYTFTYNMTATNTRRLSGCIMRYGGVDTATAPVVTRNSGDSTSLSASGTVTTVADTRIVALFGIYSEGTISNPSGMTQRYVYTATNGPGIEASDLVVAAAGPTGNKTATSTQTGGWVAHMVALKPASTVTTITVTATASPKTYDASTTASVVCTATGIAPGHSVTITYTPPATFNNKNVGTGKLVTVSGISLTGADASKYALSSTTATTTASISKAPLYLTAVLDSKVYDGSDASSLTPSVLGVVSPDTVTGAVQKFDSKNAGVRTTFLAQYNINDGNNGNNYDVYLTNNYVSLITEKPLSITAGNGTKTYDGGVTSTGTPIVAGLVAPDSAVATQTYDTKNVGTGKTLSISEYIVTDGNSGGNYSVSTHTNTTGVITARPLSITAVTATKTYDGGVTSTGTPAVVGLVGGDTVSPLVQVFGTKDVGTGKTLSVSSYTVNDGNSGGNYSVSTHTNTTGVITAKGLTITGAAAENKTYDGSVDATMTYGGATLNGVVGTEDVGYDASAATATFSDKDVADGKTVTAAGVTLTGGDMGNYSLTQPTATADITAKGLTITGAAAENKTYDGSVDATVSFTSATLVGVVDTEDVGYDADSYTAAFDNKNVGGGKWVTVLGVTLTGGDMGNYSLTQPGPLSADIDPLGITGAFTASNKTYDATTTAVVTSRSLVGTIAGDDVALSGGTANFENKNVGTDKRVWLSGATLSGTDYNNYSLDDVADAKADITAKGLTITGAAAENKTYDGSVDATMTYGGATLNGVVGTEDVGYDASAATATFSDKDVADGKTVTAAGVTLTGGDMGNYSLTQPTATADITAKGLTITGAAAENKTYDGSVDATMTYGGATLNGVVGTEDVGYDASAATATFSDKDVADGKTVTAAGVTLTGGDMGNYSLTQPTATADITAKGLTITGAAAENKTYDGSVDATVSFTSATLVGVVDTEDVGYDADSYTAAFDNKNVGGGKWVTVLGVTLTGGDMGNYSLTQPGPLSADIDPLGITGAFTASNKTYDATTTAVVTSRSLVGTIAGDDVALSGGTANFENKNVGTDKRVWLSGATLSGTDYNNYSLDDVADAKADITAKGLTITGAAAENKTYDGSVDATMTYGGATLNGVVGTEDVGYDASAATATFSDKDVADGKTVTAAGVTLTGGDMGNYSLTQPTATADITAKAVTGSFTANNKVYDGTIDASVLTSALAGTVGGDSVRQTGGTVTFDTRNAGTAKIVTWTGAVLGGADKDNYALPATPTTTTANITPLAVIATAIDTSKTAGAADPTLTYTYDPALITGDSFTGALARSVGETVGTYPITQGTLALSSDYALTFVPGIFTINAEIVVVPSTNGSITPSTTQTVEPGSDSPTFTITPDPGYHFVSATDNGEPLVTVPGVVPGTRQFKLTGVTANHIIVVVFAIDTFTLNYTADANGSIVGSATQVVDYNASGSSVTASPNAGFHFVKWSDESTANPRTDTGVKANIDVQATFEADAPGSFTIVASASSNGTITPSGDVTVTAGDNITFLFEAADGYHIATVTVDASVVTSASASNPTTGTYTFEDVQANHTIDVTFEQDSQLMPVYRFLNLKYGTHFYTADKGEYENVLNNKTDVLRYEGVSYKVMPLDSADGTVPVYRFLSKKYGYVHFYTANQGEMTNVKNNMTADWLYEGVAYNVWPETASGLVPVNRFLNLIYGVHFYTASESEYNTAIAMPTYKLEGIGFYVVPIAP